MNIKDMINDAELDSSTINQVVSDFQKAGAKYNGMQCAVALEILLHAL